MDRQEMDIPQASLAAIDEELERRFAPHAGDPIYDEIRRVRRKELIAIARSQSAAEA